MRKLILAGVAAMTLGAASAHADPILANGDFETGDFTGWTNSGDVKIDSSADYNFNHSSTGTTNTDSFALFGSHDGSVVGLANGVLTQTIATDAGQIYNLSFSYGAVGPNAGATAAVQSISVAIGGFFTQTVTSAVSTNDLAAALADYTFSFTATGTSTLITFSDTSAITANIDGLLDNVSIPEPTSMLVLGTSLIALGGARRRRTKG